MNLRRYQGKRNFSKSPEPKGKTYPSEEDKDAELRFVVQIHDATRLHYDLRLEIDGVFKSWAVPKEPSLDPNERRLAVFVEDHPLEYGSFEGIIPKGNYGAGTVKIWDRGTYVERRSISRGDSESAMKKGLGEGRLTFILKGERLKGEFALVQLKKDPKLWLLIKKREVKRKEVVTRGKLPATKSKVIDPLPRRIKPMQPVLSGFKDEQTLKDNYILEPFLKGVRVIAEVEDLRVNLTSKGGLSLNKKYLAQVDQLKQLKTRAVFDGEIKDDIYHIYDLLYFNDRDLRREPLKKRKALLVKNFKVSFNKLGSDSRLRILSSPTEPDPSKGEWVAKEAQSPYLSGISPHWLRLSTSKATEPEAKLTHLDKVYFPRDQLTKGDLIEYYSAIAPSILPYLKDRPESLHRHPNGIHGEGFFQKDLTGHLPRWLETKTIHSESSGKSINYFLCQNKESLLYMINLGCIEINPWFSRISSLDHPDFLVIDLDPDDNTFEEVMDIAHQFHRLLDQIQCPHACKTSGATGIHIGIPLQAKYQFETAREFAQNLCEFVKNKNPSNTSILRNPERRKHKIYLDFMQNRRGQTLAAPFCVRPREGAPVSMPIKWSELKRGLEPRDFHMRNAIKRIKRMVDSWTMVLGGSADLVRCARRLKQLA